MAEPNQALYYGMENSTTADPPCTNPHEFPDDVWRAWNTAGGEERMAYIEHAEMLIDRGYIQLTEGRNLMDVAMAAFAAKFETKKKELEAIRTINKLECTTSTEQQTLSTAKPTSGLLPP